MNSFRTEDQQTARKMIAVVVMLGVFAVAMAVAINLAV